MEENQNTPPVNVPTTPEVAPLISVMPTNPTKRSYTSLLLAILFVLLVAGGAAYYILHAKKTSTTIEQSIAPNETYLQLKNNPDFISAREASLQGRYADALGLYAKVIPATTGEYSYIQYEIAANTLSLNGPQGIQAFGNLVASSSINIENKAYSLVVLTNYYSLTSSTGTLALIQASANTWQGIVSEENLALLRNAQSPDDARIALAEMSTTLYPTSAAEVWLGYLYARKARDISTTNPENTAEAQSYIEKSQNHLAIADTDPDKTKESENLRSTVPAILMRRALAIGILEKIGQSDQDASAAYESAIALAIQERTIVPFFYYNYASYLVSKQNPDEEKARTILIKIVEMKDSRAFPILRDYVRNMVANNITNESDYAKKLFVIHPPFEQLIRQ